MKKRIVLITAVLACLLLCFVLAGCAEQTAYENMINNSQTQQGQTGLNDHTTEQTRPGQSGNGTQGQSQATPEPGNEQPGQSHDTTGQTQQDNQPSQPQTPAEDPAALDFNFEERAGGGYAVTSYKGTAKTVTIPSTYKGKNVVTIGTSKMDGITRIADGMTNSYDVEEIIIPDTVRAIGFGAFAYCVSLKEIHIPNVAKVDGSAFLNCTNLTKITIDGGVLDINTFKGCERVKEIVLGKNVTGIKSELFAECTSLERLTLPDIEANTFGALFKRVYFTYNGDLVPETTVSGRYNYNGSSYVYNKPADNTNWLMPTRVTTWQGQQVVWDGNPAVTTGNYKTVTLVLNETCRVPTSGSFYGYTVPQTLETVTMTSPTCASAPKFTGCSFINVILPHTFAESWSTSDTQHWHAATCGHELKTDVANHNWGAWVVTKAPTCTETGSRKHTCTVCGKTVSESIAMTAEHTYATTWSADETQHWRAAICGHELKTDVANHNWGEWVVTKAPTCTETGSRKHTCTVCGKTVSESIAVTQEHTFAETWSTSDTQHWHSATCGHNSKADVENHSWGKWVVTKEPTCTQTGSRKHTCTVCGQTVSETMQATGHRYNADNICTVCEAHKYLQFSLSNGTYSVTGTDKTITTVVIPSTYNGLPVTAIGGSGFYGYYFRSITIPDSVTSIGNQAFSHCVGLTSITIPDSVTRIEQCCFESCTGLTSVTIPEGVTSIGEWAFSGCTGLTSITIPDSVTSIGRSAFCKCRGLTSIAIPDSVTSIGSYAFSNCTKLTSVTIGSGVTSIGEGAFNQCSGLTAVYITDVAKWCGISFNGFATNPLYYAHNLYVNGVLVTELVIPDSVTSIGYGTFDHCTGLTSITIPNSVTSIGGTAFFGCTKLTTITIPDSVTSIGDAAFGDCTGLTAVYITDVAKWCGISFSRDDANPLYYVNNLYVNGVLATELIIPDSVTRIGQYAFCGYTSLKCITIPDSVTSIGQGAFRNCTGLTNVIIPEGVTSIGGTAFSGCTKLTTIIIPESVTSIGQGVFNGCKGLSSITVAEGNTIYHSAGNCLIKTASKTLIAGCKTSVIPTDGSVTSIGEYAFSRCAGLTSIVIPDSVTSIGKRAFNGCTALKSITISNSVTSIGDYAFFECTGLSNIIFTGTSTQWAAVSKGEFWNFDTGSYTIHCG